MAGLTFEQQQQDEPQLAGVEHASPPATSAPTSMPAERAAPMSRSATARRSADPGGSMERMAMHVPVRMSL